MKNQRNLVFVASILLVGLVDAKNFFTPLNKGYEFACVAENLKVRTLACRLNIDFICGFLGEQHVLL